MNVFISSHLENSYSVFTTLHETSSNQFQIVQNKLLTKSARRPSVIMASHSLNYMWSSRYLPTLCKDWLLFNPSRNLRSSDHRLLAVPHVVLKTNGFCDLEVAASLHWNPLLLE